MALRSKIAVVLVATAGVLVGCKEDAPVKTQPAPGEDQALRDTALVIGTFYGFCRPPDSCVEVYKLTNNQIYADTTHHYPYDTSGYQFVTLVVRQDQAIIQRLKSNFPHRLVSDTTTEFGCPDCRDQGGFYVSLTAKGYQQAWLIDKDLDAVSPYLRPFLRKVDSLVQRLP